MAGPGLETTALMSIWSRSGRFLSCGSCIIKYIKTMVAFIKYPVLIETRTNIFDY